MIDLLRQKTNFYKVNTLFICFIKNEDMAQSTVDEYLKSVYYDPKRPGSFGGTESLYRDVKQEGKFKLSRKQISDWLMSQDTYTLHKFARRNFKRNRVIVGGIDEEWQMDLADMQSLKQYNDEYRYLLVCTDVLSKYAWIVPIKSKKRPDIKLKLLKSF